MKKAVSVLTVLLLVSGFALVQAKEDKAEKRAAIDAMAKEAMDEVLGESESARKLYDKAFGYAVFDNLKIAIGISGGGGQGVAVEKGSGTHTYMKMGTVGVGFGLGGKKYQVVFLLENEKVFRSFVDKGWQADTQAGAAAGTAGASAESTFHGGIAIYQITEAGLVASADVSGTKYWKNKKLNKK
jgi:lipid-binding SYLF domain-containing protein